VLSDIQPFEFCKTPFDAENFVQNELVRLTSLATAETKKNSRLIMMDKIANITEPIFEEKSL
jgi:hypothetical protein